MTGFKTISKVYNYLYLTYRHVDQESFKDYEYCPKHGVDEVVRAPDGCPPPPGASGVAIYFYNYRTSKFGFNYVTDLGSLYVSPTAGIGSCIVSWKIVISLLFGF